MFGELSNELPQIIIWYLAFLILGAAGLPFLNKYFSKWKDRGYGISKFITLAAVALPLWFLSSLRIIPFTQTTALLFFVGFVGLSIWYGWKTKFKIDKSALKWMIWEEIMFLIIFVVWTFIRSTNSQVEGTEKMMNIAFMNSIYRTEYFPAADPWYYGGTINYYHLGHYMYSFIAKMTGVPISFAYNFALNTIAGFTFIGSFSIIVKLINQKTKLRGSVLAGLFGASWLCFGANLHYLYKWLEAILNNRAFEYWFPDGTRIITNVIDEFPAYSIPLGDLHGHYLGMPFLIVVIALLIVSYRIKIGTKAKLYFNLIISFLICALYGINSWDFITSSFLFGLLHAYQTFKSYKLWSDRALIFFVTEGALILPGLLFMIPYLSNFHAPVGGIGIVPFGQTSEIRPWIQMWGMFAAITGFFALTRSFINKNIVLKIIALVVIGLVLLVGVYDNLQLPFKVEGFLKFTPVENSSLYVKQWINFFALIGGFVITSLAAIKLFKIDLKTVYKKGKYEGLVFLLLFACFALLIGVETFFVKDIFFQSNPPYFRTNTVFKFFFHTWVIWCIVCSYFVYKIFTTYLSERSIRARFIGAGISFVIIIMYIGSVSYIFEAVKDFYPFMKYDNSYYPTFSQLFSKEADTHIKVYDSIDGNMYIKKNHPEDYDVIQWFNKNVKGQPTVVEAVGDAYTYYARFSANIGVINIMGWPTHEWQWRSTPSYKKGDDGKVVYEDLASTDAFARKAEVEKIYTTTSLDELKGLIAKYNVEYIIIGEKEKDSYKERINETLISSISGKVFQTGNTSVYRIMN